jgi:2-oxoisovalerate dehydrogenase E1 component beta subunit
MSGAINRALRDAMTADADVVVFGEDVGTLGGVFRVTDGIARDFGQDRCFDTPLAEAGIVSARPPVHGCLLSCDFLAGG